MTNAHASAAQKPVRFERTYDPPVEDIWELWTTKEGFESWWGPEGFRVEVHALDLREGGELTYDMIAVDPAHVAYLKEQGMPPSHATHGKFVEIVPMKRLKLRHMIDFIPGVETYSNDIVVELVPEGGKVRMVVDIEPHRDPHWTEQSAAGFESQLTKVPAALATRRR